jgi:hypothetical protein
MSAKQLKLAAYRRRSAAHTCMARIHVRPRTKRCPRFNLAAARAVLEAFGQKSVWSGGCDVTIVAINRALPLSVENSMVISTREANCKIPADVIAKAQRIAATAAKLERAGVSAEEPSKPECSA